MKVLVEFDLSIPQHQDLYQHVKAAMMSQRVEVDTKLKTETDTDDKPVCTREELIAAYKAAFEVSSDETNKTLAAMQADHGGHLSEWSPDVMWVAKQKFAKLSDSVAERLSS